MILIGAGDGIYRWTPGASWPVFHSLQHKTIVQLALGVSGGWAAVDGAGSVYESRDFGLNWRSVPAPESDGESRPTAIALGGAAPGILVLAARNAGLFYRPLGSVKGWGKLPDLATGSEADGGVGSHVRSITNSLVDPKLWFASVAGMGLWRSSDACSTWARCAGMPADILSLRVRGGEPGKELVVAGTSRGVWSSLDSGETWSSRSEGLGDSVYVAAVEINPDDPKILLAGAAPPRLSESAGKGKPAIMGFSLFESKDQGKSWSQVRRGFPELLEYDAIADIRYDPAEPDYAIAAFESGELWRTRNGGDWWEPLARQMSSARVLAAAS